MSDNGSTPRRQDASAPPISAPIDQELVPVESVSPILYAAVAAHARRRTMSPVTAQDTPTRGIHLPVPGSIAVSSTPSRNLIEDLGDRTQAPTVEAAADSRNSSEPPQGAADLLAENAALRAQLAEFERQRRHEVQQAPPEPVRPARPPARS